MPLNRKIGVSAFVVLALATVAAFFIIQHLKVTTPLIAGNPTPFPPTINPVGGGTCTVVNPTTGKNAPVSFRDMTVTFFLLHRSDDVDVYIVNQSGAIVSTLAKGLFMRALPHPVPGTFSWNGREGSGRLAPPGRYYVRVVLRQQGRTINITDSKGLLQWVTVSTFGRCPGAASLRGQ